MKNISKVDSLFTISFKNNFKIMMVQSRTPDFQSSSVHLCSISISEVLVDLWFDFTSQGKEGGDDRLLVACNASVHCFNLHFGVCFNLCIVILESNLSFCLVLLNLSLGLLLGLLQPPVLPLPGLTHLLGSSLLSSKQLLDALSLTCHCSQ